MTRHFVRHGRGALERVRGRRRIGIGAPLDNVFRALDGSVVVGFLNNPPSLVLVGRSDGVPVVMPENYASLLLVDNVTRDPNSGRVVVYSLTNPPTVTLIEGPLGPLVVFGAT